MTKIQHYINGQLVGLPRNWLDMNIDVNFNETRINEEQVSLSSYVWQNLESKIIKEHQVNGLIGGVGVFEGLRHEIFIKSKKIFDGYIDTGSANYNQDDVEAQSGQRANIDWFSETAQAITFAELYRLGYLTENDTIFIPYCVEPQSYAELAILTVSIATIQIQLQQIITKFAPGEAVEGVSVIDSVGGIIQFVFTIIYAIFLMATLIKLFLDLFELIIQRIKYKPAMYVYRQMEAVCQYFGIQFQSNWLYSEPWKRMVSIPESYSNPLQDQQDNVRGFFTPNKQEQLGFFNGVAYDLINELKSIFDTRLIFGKNTMSLEPFALTVPNARFQIPAIDNRSYRFNADEISANITFSFAYDVNDFPTMQEWIGTNFQLTLQPRVVADRVMNLLKGSKIISTRFALLKTKKELNVPEKILNVFFQVFGGLIGVLVKVVNAAVETLNKVLRVVNRFIKTARNLGIKIKFTAPSLDKVKDPNLQNLIENRIGAAKLGSDILTAPKLAIIVENSNQRLTKVDPKNDTILSAKNIVNTFHRARAFRQGEIKEWQNVPMSYEQYEQVFEDRHVFLPNGKIAEVRKYSWNPDKSICSMTTFEATPFTNNLTIKEFEPTGR